jgi:urease accessory protein
MAADANTLRRLSNDDEAWLVWQLADSAFPTGGFAHSWGLEASWQSGEVPDLAALQRFVRDSLWQTGHAGLPFVTAAWRAPDRIGELDRISDVFLINAVANRASRVQGRAFVSTCARIWPIPALVALDRHESHRIGHCAPLVGATLRALAVPLETTQRLFLFSTARGILTAAVKLGIVGSYQAQRLQYEAGAVLDEVRARCGDLEDADVSQTAPLLDVLQSAHDRLYSRLFQS